MCSQSNMYIHIYIYIYIYLYMYKYGLYLYTLHIPQLVPRPKLASGGAAAEPALSALSISSVRCGNHRKTMGKPWENGDFTKNTWGFHGIYS